MQDDSPDTIRDAQTIFLSGDDSLPCDMQEKFLTALNNLNDLPLIGVVDRYDESMVVFEEYLKAFFPNINLSYIRRNITDENINVSAKEKAETFLSQLEELTQIEVKEKNKFDMKLYDTANIQLDAKIASIGNFQGKLINFKDRCILKQAHFKKSKNDYKGVVDLLTPIVKRETNIIHIYLLLANVDTELKQYSKALNIYEETMRKFPANPWAYFYQTEVYGLMGEENKAKKLSDLYALQFKDNINVIEHFQKRSKKISDNKIFLTMQDITFPLALSDAEKVIVILVPEQQNMMTGGILSLFSIGDFFRRLKKQHGYEVVLMTLPSLLNETYCRQKNFQNSEDIFRFEQIERCSRLKELYLHIPEYATRNFVKNLSENTLDFLKSLDKLDINILNQNIEQMPESVEFQKLRDLADALTQSVAHHAYFSQKFADKFNLPTLLLPPYIDLSRFDKSTLEEKDNLIIYSPDNAPYKSKVLAKIQSELPEYELIEIRNIIFDDFMELATRCKFSISFGEGFDGYVGEVIMQGGIGMTVYNEAFFPAPYSYFFKYNNIFENESKMVTNIIDTIKALTSEPEEYKVLNRELVAEQNKLYSLEKYVVQIKKLINKEFDLFPHSI